MTELFELLIGFKLSLCVVLAWAVRRNLRAKPFDATQLEHWDRARR